MPEDLNPDDITTPGPADDEGIDMPGNARGVENWLRRLGLLDGGTAVETVFTGKQNPFEIYNDGNNVWINISEHMANNSLDVYNLKGMHILHQENNTRYAFQLPYKSVYLISFLDRQNGKNYSRRISL